MMEILEDLKKCESTMLEDWLIYIHNLGHYLLPKASQSCKIYRDLASFTFSTFSNPNQLDLRIFTSLYMIT